MPLVAYNNLPSFDRLREEGIRVLAPSFALHQDIRELHIGLLNMMPDAALAATERQFFRLIGESNPIAQFYVYPFTLDELPRSEKAKAHIDKHYLTFDELKKSGLDALIITGANVQGSELSQQPFWEPLKDVFEWAYNNVTSTLCSCLATHAVLEFQYKQKRQLQDEKIWGVYEHHIADKKHPLVEDINTRFSVPHSRWNEVSLEQFQMAGLKILATSDENDVHLATSADGIRTVFFQGHPEYDTISLLKEYKREIILFLEGKTNYYPPFPEHYFGQYEKALFNEFRYRIENSESPEFPEKLVISHLDNTWHDTAGEVVSNWMGLIYQLTHRDRHLPFMDHLNPNNPLNLE